MSWTRKRQLRRFETIVLHRMLALLRAQAEEYANGYGKNAEPFYLGKAVNFELAAQDVAEVLSERAQVSAPQALKAFSP